MRLVFLVSLLNYLNLETLWIVIWNSYLLSLINFSLLFLPFCTHLIVALHSWINMLILPTIWNGQMFTNMNWRIKLIIGTTIAQLFLIELERSFTDAKPFICKMRSKFQGYVIWDSIMTVRWWLSVINLSYILPSA